MYSIFQVFQENILKNGGFFMRTVDFDKRPNGSGCAAFLGTRKKKTMGC